MLNEYVLLPCIFDRTCFQSDEICNLYLKNLKETLLYEEALVRDLWDGEWSKFVKKISSKHPNTKYILRDLKTQLFAAPATQTNLPNNYNQWADEALRYHQREPLNGIISSKSTKEEFKDEKIIASIEQLNKADWWKNRVSSVCVQRATKDYLKRLKLILERANSIMFIDPYFNPFKPDYEDFYLILQAIKRADDPPDIEIHLCHLESPKTAQDYEDYFRKKLTNVIKQAKLEVQFFIWDRFHDRYIITNLVGIMSGNSFSVSREREETTWTRLDRQRKDEVQVEFDKNSNKHKLQHYFTIF